MVATNKRLIISESRGDSNRCTPYRENLINTTHTLPTPVHVCPVYASCGQSTYVATIHEVINSDGQSYCSREKGHPIQSTARRLIDSCVHTQFLSQGSH
jgi:hypothetical protein